MCSLSGRSRDLSDVTKFKRSSGENKFPPNYIDLLETLAEENGTIRLDDVIERYAKFACEELMALQEGSAL